MRPKGLFIGFPGGKLLGQQPKTGIPGLVFLKNGYTLKPKKRTPRAITPLIDQKHIVPVYWPFLRDNDPQVHLPAANYVLRRVQVQFGCLKSGWDQVWVGSGCQSPGRVLWWQACAFHLVSECACLMPYTINRDRVQQS